MKSQLSINALRSGLISSSIVLLVILFIPSEIYFNNYREFNYLYSEISLWLILLCIPPILLLTSILSLLRQDILKLASSILVAILISCWINGYISYPDYGPLDGRMIDWDNWNAWGYINIITLAITLAAFIYLKKFIFRYSNNICIIIISTFLINFSYNYNKYTPDENSLYEFDYQYMPNFSTKQNIIVILLDELQSDVFYELLNENEIIKNVFNGFTYYPDTISGYAWTLTSIPLLMTGQYYYNTVPFTPDYIKESYTKTSLTKDLINLGYRIELFPKFVDINYYKSGELADNVIRKEQTRNLDRTIGNASSLIALSLFKISPHFVREYIYDNHIYPQSGKDKRLTWSHIDYWRQDIHFVRNIEKNSRVVYQDPVFKLYHLRGSHVPWMYNKDGDIVKHSGSRNSYKEHILHTLKLTNDILKEIYSLGIYDKSLIYILSDHGAGRSDGTIFNPHARDRSRAIGTYAVNSVIPPQIKARAIPLFMKKPFNSRGPLKISDIPVSTSDFSEILQNDLKSNWNKDTGKVYKDNYRKHLYYYTNTNDIQDEYIADMLEYNIKGDSWLDSSWDGPNRIYSNNTNVYKKILSIDLRNDHLCSNNTGGKLEDEFFDISNINKNEYQIRIKREISNQTILGVFPNFTDEKNNDFSIYANGKRIGNVKSGSLGYRINKPYELIYLDENNLDYGGSNIFKIKTNGPHQECLNKSISSLLLFDLEEKSEQH